jgi:hypothetical protein
MKKLLIISLGLGISGCASVAPPVIDKESEGRSIFLSSPFHGERTEVGTDSSGAERYRVYVTGTTGFTNLSEVKANAGAEAEKYCAQQRKTVKRIEERTSVAPHVANNYPRFEIVFVCF